MKKKLIIGSLLFAFISIIILTSFNMLTRRSADWKLVQSVGGIKTGIPLETEDGLYLPVTFNVSGLDSVTTKPTTLNSMLFCLKTKVAMEENRIYLNVIVGMGFSKDIAYNCKAVNIGHLKLGHYYVYYGSKTSEEHQIGQFEIMLDEKTNLKITIE